MDRQNLISQLDHGHEMGFFWDGSTKFSVNIGESFSGSESEKKFGKLASTCEIMKLPIDEVRSEILREFTGGEPWRMLVKAPTGSGKSTGLPSILLDGGGLEGMIVVVQPRRIAARMLARRVASLRGCSIGGEVGYVVRFDHKMSKQTRIVYVTDGVLQRWLEENPQLSGIDAVIFDEFHERRLAMDVALADCLELQENIRSELKVCVMSATLELAGLDAYLSPCRLLEAGGRAFPVEMEYQRAAQSARGVAKDEPVWMRCQRAVIEASKRDDCGNILVFLPGVYEIQRTVDQLKHSGLGGWEICPLYGSLKPEQQDRAVREGGGPRIIVATNVAETSLTIPGVRTVVDTGLARVAVFDAGRGMDTLFVQKISRAAAEQRAGRAGRVAPGRAVRLWSEADQARRDAFELPEVQRVDITEVILNLHGRGLRDVQKFRWLTPPSAPALAHAEELLEDLGAIDADGITALGKQMARMPLHPRMARLLLAAQQEDCLAEAIFVAALLQGEGLFLKAPHSGRTQFVYDDDRSDFCSDWRGFESARAMGYQPQRCNAIGVMARAARELAQSIQQLERVVLRHGWQLGEINFSAHHRALSRAMLAAFRDNLAVTLGAGTLSCRLCGNRSGKLAAESAVKQAEVFVVSQLTEVGGREVTVYLNGCVEVMLEDVRELAGDAVEELDAAVYDEKIRRVVNRKEVKFKDLVLWSKDGGEPDAEQAAVLLAERVAAGELKLKKWDASVEQWIARLLCLRQWMPELELPGFDEDDRAIALEMVCAGALSYKQIKDKDVMPALQSWLSPSQHAVLNAYAPARIKLANGKEIKLKYEVGKPPSMALTVQRLYGVTTTPTVADGRVKVQIHICAPNQRPWQMTQDLENFWLNGFEQMKKDLAGRYPKHDWSGSR